MDGRPPCNVHPSISMNATLNQTVVASFISFLRKQNISEEHTEGIEITIQCLSEAFELNDSLIKYLSISDLASLIKGPESSAAPVSSDDKAEAERQKVQGNEFIAANKPEKALECYSKAINHDPSNAIYFSNRAAAHSMLGDHFSALEDAKMSCKLNPNYAKAYNRLGKAHLALGEPEDAIVAFTKALEIDPKDSSVKVSLESARRASSGEHEEVEISKSSKPAPSQFPGMPAGMDFASIMNNPQFMSMAQQMMQSGALNDMLKDPKTKDMMKDFMDNPDLMKKFAGSKTELKDLLKQKGFEDYRADQLFTLIYRKSLAERFIPQKLMQFVRENFDTLPTGTIERESVSEVDGTRKLLIELGSPKYKVESVLICERERNTSCLSSQVGCSLSCKFCHTGTQKLLKNLSTSEIISQFLLAKQSLSLVLSPKRIDNIVFMGQGEPLYNWRNVSRAVRILTDPFGPGVSKSKVTISTSGIAPLIPKISEELGVQLAISLHATNDAIRSSIMPINDTYNIKSVLEACEEFVKHAKCYNRRISFEYVLLRGVNDTISKDAKELVELLKNLPSHVNLIPFNKWPGSEFECSNRQRIIEFNDYLNSHGLRSSIRWSRGDDILAACGQLRSNEELKSAYKQ